LNLNHASTAEHTAKTLFDIVRPVKSELDDSMQLLAKHMKNDVPFVDRLLRHGNLLSGKRLRPLALFLAAGAVGRIDPRHKVLAAAIEMIHTATLIHDDVLDESETRRHHRTIHDKWNVPTAVLLGDYLFSNAFFLASTTGCADACLAIGESTNLVCEGELQQVDSQSNFELSEAEYLGIIAGKTGRLISCATRLGTFFQHPGEGVDLGIESGDREVSVQMEQYGANVGIAFQIMDDVLDLVGTGQKTGKTLRTDLLNQKPTLPIIRALAECNSQQKAGLLKLLRDPTGTAQSEILAVLQDNGAIESSLATAATFAERALQNLEGLEESRYLNSLQMITRFLTTRKS